ncbi:MAG: ribonuclease Z [Bacteroidia bacterium]|nr:ribonuclease Z [Bacteroidia bacterium]MBT8309466.1 ribonuclease Z [Bacteroidia bacterium]NND11310.1 ribonuclease Z [Flavobacteriaceae bacterium]NNK28401.1 ribonuclease Z [Flavobacteriaceae bacterium]NNL61283.1 ribonuclease Z [Flavobacteriaceae bacterium]
MIFDKDGNIVIITQEKLSTQEFVQRLDSEYHRFKNDNVVINLTALEQLSLDEIIEFLQVSNRHRLAKHSFVIVTDKVDFDEMPDEIIIVPTMQEAYDIIEMEEIERDLGF